MASGAAGGGIGQAAGELLKEMQQAQADVQKLDQQKSAAPNEGFQQAMQVQETQKANDVKGITNATGADANHVLVQAKDGPSAATVGATEKAENSKIVELLNHVSKSQDQMDVVIKEAMSGKQFSTSELIGLQAVAYRFTQELDLVSKVVEKATSGIKQTLNTQV